MEQVAPESRRYTLEEYFQLEAESEDRWEFRDGEVVCMSGGSVNHSRITLNIGGELRQRLKGSSCTAFEGSLRVRLSKRTLYGHPDVAVVCGEPELDPDDERGETIINPKLIVEVLSPSTELYNRTKKFDRYRHLESFEEYVLVSQGEALVETFYRQPGGSWRLIPTAGLDQTVALTSIGIDLPMGEVYAGVKFQPLQPESGTVIRL